jgi:hypothetical protein
MMKEVDIDALYLETMKFKDLGVFLSRQHFWRLVLLFLIDIKFITI